MNIDPDFIVSLVRDKSQVLKKILEIIERNQKQAEGCAKLRESLVRKENPNLSNENIARCAQVALATSSKNSEDLLFLSQFILVYCQSNTFTTDAAMMANKLGKGDEALRAMMAAKFGGKID